MNPVAQQARAYLERGWQVTPIRPRCGGTCGEARCSCGKRPLYDDWPKVRIDAGDVERHFRVDNNIGVVLGDVSGGLVDIDLDVPEAIALAAELLPDTRTFGREGAPGSHWLYLARGARTEKFTRPLGGARNEMLVELRANKSSEDGEGLQTVFPGSTHNLGERIDWDSDQAITELKPEQLRQAVARLAAATLLMRTGWPMGRASAFGKAPSADQLREVADPVHERIARWLGYPARPKQPTRSTPAPRRPPDDNRVKRAAAYLQRIPGAVSGAGGHQQTWGVALTIVRGFDLDQADAYALLSEYNQRCDPPWSERELRHKIEDAERNGRAERGYLLKVDRRAPAPPNGHSNGHNGHHQVDEQLEPQPPAEWEPPIDFDTFDLPPFPVDALPGPIADFVRALAEATQTPLDLGGMLALATAAACAAKRVLVEVRPGYREPVNLFTAVVLPPGERKSAVLRDITAPLVAWEANAGEEKAAEIRKSQQRWAISKKRLDALSDRLAKTRTKEEREKLELEVDQLTEEHGSMKVATEPRLLADDSTPEALASLLAQHGGRIAIFSAEGGVFQQMVGKYSDSPTLDVYLKGHAGDEIRVDRKGRASERIADPALTLGLAIQPSILEAFADKPVLRGTGLLARFLYALPTSMLGARKQDAPPIPEHVRAAYEQALKNLLVLQHASRPITLKFSPAAYLAWCEFSAWLEPQLGEFGELESIRDWASKLAGAVARISGVLSILSILSLKSGFEDPSILIQVTEVQRAVAIARYLVPHAQAAIAAMGADDRVQAAKHMLRCLRRKAWTQFSRRELHRALAGSGRFKEVEQLEPTLKLLVQRHFIREAPQPEMTGPGRPPSKGFEVNPLWTSKTPKNLDTIDTNTPVPIPGRGPIRDREPGEDDDQP